MSLSMSSGDHPRLLVLSQEVPQTVRAGCIILYRLLKGWPTDRLWVLGPEAPQDGQRLDCEYRVLEPPGERLCRTRFSRWYRSFETIGLCPYLRPEDIDRRLEGFRPDAVLSVMQTRGYYGAAWRFTRDRGVPHILIVHDIPEDFEGVFWWAKKAQARFNARVYRDAARRLCVSPEMKDFFAERHGARGDVMYPNPAEGTEPRSPDKSRRLIRDGVLTVGYAGSLVYGYGHQLQRMIPSFRSAGAQLRLYSPGTLPDGQGVVEHVGVAATPEETWLRIQSECDVVILAYSWPEYGHQELYRTHFPSKLPEYLQLGMPVIIVGPSDATGVKWGLRNPDAALTLAREDPREWTGALRRLKESPDQRETLAREAVLAARRDFDPAAIRETFLRHVRDAVAENRSRRG